MPGQLNMKSYEKLEKSKGVLLFANNTSTIDYVKIATRSQQLIEHYLKLPVTIVSNNTNLIKNQRYSIDSNKFEPWNNLGRGQAYELSPYDQTVLLDCDYLIFNDQLLKVLDSTQDYLIARHNNYIDGAATTPMGTYSLPHLWATVVIFNRTEKAKLLFELVNKIERNYKYYYFLYNINSGKFRNDYAFTIADNILNGYTQDKKNYLPWPLLTVNNTIDRLELKQNSFYLTSNNKGYVLPKQDLHILSKAYLESPECANLIQEALNA